MTTIRGHDLQLQLAQKIVTKAMLPLVRLADSFLLAEVEAPALPSPTETLNAWPVWTASACSPVQTCRLDQMR